MNGQEPYTIFIVDDDPMWLETLRHNLSKKVSYPLHIYTFSSGDRYLEELQEQWPDLIFMDYYLDSNDPEADNGIQLLKKSMVINGQLLVVMLTSNKDTDAIVQCVKGGAYDYVIKDKNASAQVAQIIENKVNDVNARSKLKDKHEYLIGGLLAGGFLVAAFLFLLYETWPGFIVLLFVFALSLFFYWLYKRQQYKYQIALHYLQRIRSQREENIIHSFQMLSYRIPLLQKNWKLFETVLEDLTNHNIVDSEQGTDIYYLGRRMKEKEEKEKVN